MRQKLLSCSVSCLLTIFSISDVCGTSVKPLVADPTITRAQNRSIEMTDMDHNIPASVLSDISSLAEFMKSGRVARGISFPGGGIRGIIQASIASYIEEKSGHSISEIFHMMIGTSTGGIIAAALSAPSKEEQEKPRMKASEIENLYMQHGKEIFQELPWYKKLITLFSAKYNEKPLEKILYDICGDLKLSDAINDLMITIYNKTKGSGELMKSHFAREAASLQNSQPAEAKTTKTEITESSSSSSDLNQTKTHPAASVPLTKENIQSMHIDDAASSSTSETKSESLSSSTIVYYDATLKGDNSKYRHDFFLRDIIRGTTAAPSYFLLSKIAPIGESQVMPISAVDGGLFANDPTLFMLIEMLKIYPNADAYFLLTVGNGKTTYKEKPVRSIIDIATQLPDLLMSNNSTSEKHIMKVLGSQYNKPVYFMELQMNLPEKHSEMDNVSEANMLYLQHAAQEYLKQTSLVDKVIDELFSFPKTPRSELIFSTNTVPAISNFHMIRQIN